MDRDKAPSATLEKKSYSTRRPSSYIHHGSKKGTRWVRHADLSPFLCFLDSEPLLKVTPDVSS